MKTFKQLFNDILNQSEVNLSNNDIIDRFNHLTSIKNKDPLIVKVRSVSKFLHNLTSLNERITYIMDLFEEADGIGTGLFPNDSDEYQLLNRIVTTIFDFDIDHIVNDTITDIGCVGGNPIKIRIHHVAYTGSDYQLQVPNGNDEWLSIFEFETHTTDVTVWNNNLEAAIPMQHYDNQLRTNVIEGYSNFSDISVSAAKQTENCLAAVDMVESCFLNGSADQDILQSIINKYRNTEAAEIMTQTLAGISTVNNNTVLALIKPLVEAMTGTKQSNDDEYYAPNANFQYISDVAAYIGVIVGQVIATMLSVIISYFNVIIGAIVFAITQVVMSILNAVSSKVSGEVLHDSDYPCCNAYLGTITINNDRYPTPPFQSINNAFIADFCDGKDGVNAIPCFVNVSINNQQSSINSVPWIIRGRDSQVSYFLQMCFPVAPLTFNGTCDVKLSNEAPADYPIAITYRLEEGDASIWRITGIEFGSNFNYSFTEKADSKGWVDEDVARISLNNRVLALLLQTIGLGMTNEYTLQVPPSYQFKATVGSSSLSVALDEFYDFWKGVIDPVIHPSQQISATVLSYMALNFLQMLSSQSLSLGRRMITGADGLSWDDLGLVLTHKSFDLFIRRVIACPNKTYNYMSIYNSSDNASYIIPAVQLMNPAYKLPSISLNSIIMASVITTVCTVAIATAAIVIGKQLKARAVGKLARREVEFEKAKQSYLADPSNSENRKAFYKANKRLGRAWNRAGAVGVSSFNGFATTSETVALNDEATANMSKRFSSAYADETIGTVIRLIAGENFI